MPRCRLSATSIKDRLIAMSPRTRFRWISTKKRSAPNISLHRAASLRAALSPSVSSVRDNNPSRRARLERQSRIEPFGAEMRGGEQAAEVGVSRGRLREQHDVAAIRQRDFSAGDCLDVERLGGSRELQGGVHAVAIGERERGITEPVCFGEELVWWRGAIQEGEGGVAMKLCVHGGGRLGG